MTTPNKAFEPFHLTNLARNPRISWASSQDTVPWHPNNPDTVQKLPGCPFEHTCYIHTLRSPLSRELLNYPALSLITSSLQLLPPGSLALRSSRYQRLDTNKGKKNSRISAPTAHQKPLPWLHKFHFPSAPRHMRRHTDWESVHQQRYALQIFRHLVSRWSGLVRCHLHATLYSCPGIYTRPSFQIAVEERRIGTSSPRL